MTENDFSFRWETIRTLGLQQTRIPLRAVFVCSVGILPFSMPCVHCGEVRGRMHLTMEENGGRIPLHLDRAVGVFLQGQREKYAVWVY